MKQNAALTILKNSWIEVSSPLSSSKVTTYHIFLIHAAFKYLNPKLRQFQSELQMSSAPKGKIIRKVAKPENTRYSL
jgi:hypothetical protein